MSGYRAHIAVQALKRRYDFGMAEVTRRGLLYVCELAEELPATTEVAELEAAVLAARTWSSPMAMCTAYVGDETPFKAVITRLLGTRAHIAPWGMDLPMDKTRPKNLYLR